MRKFALLLAAVVAVAGFSVALPVSPASAASLCTKVANHVNGSGQAMAVPASSGGGDNCLIGYGNLGCYGINCESVKQLQRTLNVCYQKHLDVDGEFGTNTYNALVDAQRRSGTTPDGTYGPNTRSAMRHQSNDVPTLCRNY